MRKVKFGEYEIIEDLKNGKFECLRHGEEWRSLIGDNMVLALIDKFDEMKERIEGMQEDVDFLNQLEAYGVDNWDGYGMAREAMMDEEDDDDEDEYETIMCSQCMRYKPVEKGTWALEEGMCERCYCEYQGG